jgi:dTMP kinase
MQKGTFIVLEGPDGSGTTTHAALLAERLRAEGLDVVQTAEPTDSPIGKCIRGYLASSEGISASPLQLLFCADRAWHVEMVIRPALAEGKVVVCDRYIPSTLVYGASQGLDTQWLRKVNSAFPAPDCLMFALPPLAVCLERIGRRSERELFETEILQQKIHAEYRKLADEDPSVTVLDTSGSKQETADAVYALAMKALGR